MQLTVINDGIQDFDMKYLYEYILSFENSSRIIQAYLFVWSIRIILITWYKDPRINDQMENGSQSKSHILVIPKNLTSLIYRIKIVKKVLTR